MSDLDELKTLLFGPEKQVLDSIQQRVQTPEARAADIAAVLPEAVRLSHAADGELAESLKDPVGRCLRDSFRESPQEFADALYPVMGPAIRKSIVHTLKAFAQQINQTLEHSLTFKGLKWRLEAARAGVPFASYVIQQSLAYRVEQAYLISRENGLLIAHVHHEGARIKDSDAVSAMFTAIQDFVKESFSPDRSGRLETADMGEFTLWAVHGPHALLVCVIRGLPPRALREDLTRILERLHFRFGDAIRDYAGDTTRTAGIDDELSRCLLLEAMRSDAGKRRRRPWPLIVALLLLLAAAGYWAFSGWQDSQRRARLAAVLADTPGYYVGRIERDGDAYRVYGLRDPLAPALAEVAARAGLAPASLRSELRPYRALDEAIQLERARRLLGAGPGVSVALVDDTLVVSGRASAERIAAIRARATTLEFDWPVTLGDLELAGWPELAARVEGLSGRDWYFSEGAELVAADAAALPDYAAALAALAGEARELGGSLRVVLTGFTDGSGTPAFNEELAERRVAAVREALLAAGFEASQIRSARRIPDGDRGTVAPALRRVQASLELEPAAQ